MGHEYFVTKKENLTDRVNFWDKFHKDLKEKKKKKEKSAFLRSSLSILCKNVS